MIELNGVSVRVGEQMILRGISLTLGRGQSCALLGANGAGKSTLLSTIGGDVAATAGQILLDGRPVGTWPLHERARIMGMLHQDTTLDFPFEVAEVVMMGRTSHTDVSMRENLDVCTEVIAAFELTALAERNVATLSGGERQRVQIARVFAQIWDRMGESLLLLDEPTTALDMRYQELIAGRIRDMADAGGTVVAAIHDLNLALRSSDHVVLLRDGIVLASGDPAAVMSEANVEAAYGLPVSLLESAGHGLLVVPR